MDPKTAWTEFSFVLKPTPLGGIGVFATHSIHKGTVICTYSFRIRVLKTETIPRELLPYCFYLNNKECLCPERFDRMELAWYINHSDIPNIGKDTVVFDIEELSSLKPRYYFALRDIEEGEEILINYGDLTEPLTAFFPNQIRAEKAKPIALAEIPQ